MGTTTEDGIGKVDAKPVAVNADGLSAQEAAALETTDEEVQDLAAARKEIEAAAGGQAAADKEAEARATAEAEAEEKAKAAKEAAEKAAKEAEAAKDDAAKQKAAADAKAAQEAADKAAAEARKAREDSEAAAAKIAKDAADKAAAGEKKEEKKPAPAAGDDEDPPFVPRLRAEPVVDFEKKIEALDAREQAAADKFKAGDISFEENQAEMKAINKERSQLEQQNFKATLYAEQEQQIEEQRWQWQIDRFYRKVLREEGLDYADSARLNSALDVAVKALANDERNKDKPSTWFLEEGHKVVKATLKLGGGAGGKTQAELDAEKAATDAKAKAEAEKAAAAKRAAARKDIAPSLGQLPAGPDPDLAGGEFSELDGLTGMDLENALAKMPKERQDRYLRGG